MKIVVFYYYSSFIKDKNDILKSKEDLLNIERPIFVGGNLEIRRPFISNEKRCEKLPVSVGEEILRDISATPDGESEASDISILPGTFVLIGNSIGQEYESVHETILHVFSSMKTTISRKSFNCYSLSSMSKFEC